MEQPHSYNSNFVKEFTIAILKTIQKTELNIKNPQIIHADLIPELSQELMQSITKTQEGVNTLINIHDELGGTIGDELQQESSETLQRINLSIQKEEIKPKIPPQESYSNRVSYKAPPKLSEYFISSRGGMSKYGKIQSLLMDPTIMSIQCSGPTQSLSIVKRGQRQTTKIMLSQDEINEVLTKFAEDAHIPFTEGPFQAIVNDMNIAGVSSSLVGSSFIINRTHGKF